MNMTAADRTAHDQLFAAAWAEQDKIDAASLQHKAKGDLGWYYMTTYMDARLMVDVLRKRLNIANCHESVSLTAYVSLINNAQVFNGTEFEAGFRAWMACLNQIAAAYNAAQNDIIIPVQELA